MSLQSLRISCILLFYARKIDTTIQKGHQFSVRNTKIYKIRKLYTVIFFTFYSVLQPNFAVLGCSSMLFNDFHYIDFFKKMCIMQLEVFFIYF